jgi:DNA polymerase I-like protein with 3'-5' exonuclease and polymerase domains
LDEVEFECDDEVVDEIARLIEKAIKKAGEHLKLNIELAGEGQSGLNWRAVH